LAVKKEPGYQLLKMDAVEAVALDPSVVGQKHDYSLTEVQRNYYS
jgi:hypothetical protein